MTNKHILAFLILHSRLWFKHVIPMWYFPMTHRSPMYAISYTPIERLGAYNTILKYHLNTLDGLRCIFSTLSKYALHSEPLHAVIIEKLSINFSCSLDRFRASPVNDIFCQSLPGSPLKPHKLEHLEQQQEMMKMPFRRAKEVGN